MSVSGSLSDQTTDPDAVDSKNPDGPDDLLTPGGDGAITTINADAAGLPVAE